MSAVTFWIVALTAFIIGVCFAAVAVGSNDEDAKMLLGLSTILSAVSLLVLVGVVIGGAA
jgi:uncharacterized membrane protein YhaH (DUF805 family)